MLPQSHTGSKPMSGTVMNVNDDAIIIVYLGKYKVENKTKGTAQDNRKSL